MPRDKRSLSDQAFVDALRAAMGHAPLYSTEPESVYGAELDTSTMDHHFGIRGGGTVVPRHQPTPRDSLRGLIERRARLRGE